MSQHKCYLAQPAPTEGDDANYWHDRDYFHPETGAIVPWQDLPPGAMIAHDLITGRPGPDGKEWIVKCPDGFPWYIDGPSKQGGFWNRTGEAPNFSVTPSIHVTCSKFTNAPGPDGKYPVVGESTTYHGFLTNGVLISTPDSPC